MLEASHNGAFSTGDFDPDAKAQSRSAPAAGLIHGDIAGMDSGAQGLLNTTAIIGGGSLDRLRAERYSGSQGEAGTALHADSAPLTRVAHPTIETNFSPAPRSRIEECCEILIERAQCLS